MRPSRPRGPAGLPRARPASRPGTICTCGEGASARGPCEPLGSWTGLPLPPWPPHPRAHRLALLCVSPSHAGRSEGRTVPGYSGSPRGSPQRVPRELWETEGLWPRARQPSASLRSEDHSTHEEARVSLGDRPLRTICAAGWRRSRLHLPPGPLSPLPRAQSSSSPPPPRPLRAAIPPACGLPAKVAG